MVAARSPIPYLDQTLKVILEGKPEIFNNSASRIRMNDTKALAYSSRDGRTGNQGKRKNKLIQNQRIMFSYNYDKKSRS